MTPAALLLAAYGLAWIVGHAKVSLGFRAWLHPRLPIGVALLECAGCVGFWEGFLWRLFRAQPVSEAFLYGCLVAGSNLILHSIFLWGTSHEKE